MVKDYSVSKCWCSVPIFKASSSPDDLLNLVRSLAHRTAWNSIPTSLINFPDIVFTADGYIYAVVQKIVNRYRPNWIYSVNGIAKPIELYRRLRIDCQALRMTNIICFGTLNLILIQILLSCPGRYQILFSLCGRIGTTGASRFRWQKIIVLSYAAWVVTELLSRNAPKATAGSTDLKILPLINLDIERFKSMSKTEEVWWTVDRMFVETTAFPSELLAW